ncbi:MAG: DeoR/GlpR family DNA-binding transcription regulator [Limosilactobacillus sp.]|uniref:DeoR/GlpR family DNA-binding transcription regulator n=1 Tax=Limosilactobacillus sp. TaxID=2773925 RepID=UPI003F052D92
MNQEERLQQIREWLEKASSLKTREIAQHFGVSFDTARRDVLHLTKTGQALRVHGGLMALKKDNVPSYLTRTKILSPVKEAMAQKASHFVHPEQCDFIGPSTTLVQLCRLLNGRNLQVVTNSVDNALALMEAPLPRVTLLGGELDKANRYTASAMGLVHLSQIRFNTAFVGCARVEADGIYLKDQSDSDIIQLAVKRSRLTVLVAEHYKFTSTVTAPYQAAPLDAIDVVITDQALEPAYRKMFKENVQIVQLD